MNRRGSVTSGGHMRKLSGSSGSTEYEWHVQGPAGEKSGQAKKADVARKQMQAALAEVRKAKP